MHVIKKTSSQGEFTVAPYRFAQIYIDALK